MKKTFFETIKSWRTTLIGYCLIGYYLYRLFTGSELDETVLIIGVGFIVSKDINTEK